MAREDVIKNLEELFKLEDLVNFSYLFGSRASGHERPDSDFDIAIYPSDRFIKNYDELAKLSLLSKLELNLEKALGTEKIDLIDLSNATPLLRFKVIKSGVLIFEKDKLERVSKITRWISEYLDIQPFLEYRNKIVSDSYHKDS